MKLELDTNVYPKSAILSTFSYFSDVVETVLSEENSVIYANLNFIYKDEDIIKDIYRHLLQTAMRHIIAEKTKEERELIIGRALYGSCLEEFE